MTLRIGVLPLARPTFDVPYAESMAAAAFQALEAAGFDLVGGRGLLFDAASTEAALASLAGQRLDLVLILQVTFTDATMTVAIGKAVTAPLAIWAFPEPRAGGRLRLNAFCGLNLAQHALGRAGLVAGWLYAAPDAPHAGQAIADLARKPASVPAASTAPAPVADPVAASAAEAVLQRLAGRRIGLVGEHPAGFDTCRYDAADLQRRLGLAVQPIPLPTLFAGAQAVSEETAAASRAAVGARITGLDAVDQPQLDRSLRVHAALGDIAARDNLSGFAVRCWPEMFTEYGCAACGPMGLMTGEGVPCACEADVLGTVTSLMLQEVAGEPSWLVDIVDIDPASDTGVLWHCGSAPLGMADPATPPRAQIHSNRRMPLLAEFTLKPGRVTVARLSQARNGLRMVVGGGEMVQAPMSFTGTSGVIRFDTPAGTVSDRLLGEALEHHVAIVYGEHRPVLRAMAARLGLPVLELA